MKHQFFATIIMIITLLFGCKPSGFNASDPMTYPVYDGADLGVTYSPQATSFKIWAPTAALVVVRLYNEGLGGDPIREIKLDKKDKGVWTAEIRENLIGKFYTFRAQVDDKWLNEVPGPDAKAVGANGRRGMIIDLKATNPEGWESDQRPPLASPSDIIIYELHIRDLSANQNSGITNVGKFLGLTESGTKSPQGMATGIDHLKEMGITHLHILPAFDFRSVDETKPENAPYNWGYDPQNYNVPEGSYSTNPYDGNVRIREFKQMVKALHDNGIRVVLDVVYNHVGSTNENSFDQIVPGYYFRYNPDGSFSNASGCGNETASEHPMMRKYMIESVKYWATEYHIDGFRFDLMGVHDIETMNDIADSLHQIDSSIFVYGEAWNAGNSPLPEDQRAIKKNMPKIHGVAAFSDDIRDAIKGHWANVKDKGFVSGEPEMEESIKFGIVASTQHPQVDYESVNYSKAFWANQPTQTINYVSCHDNNTLWDKLAISTPKSSVNERIRMDKMANAIVLTSQGIPFLHAGVEFLRSKQKVENSFESADSINWIDWSLKAKNQQIVEWYESAVRMRKEHPAFRMPTTEMISTHLEFMDLEPGMVGYSISGNANGDSWESILVIFNANKTSMKFDLEEGNWNLGFDLEHGYMNDNKIWSGEVILDPVSAYVFYKR